MRLPLAIWMLFVSALCANVDNSVTVYNETASSQTYTYKIARYFGSGEIANYPQPTIGGSLLTYWQSEVKTRWNDGSVRFAVIYLETTIAGEASAAVAFQNSTSASSGGSGLDKQAMLDFDAGGGTASWGCKIQTAASSVNLSASCRTMLSNDHYQVLESGPLATTVLIREGPESVAGGTTRLYSFGYQCTENCAAPYDTATWVSGGSTYQSMRPSFVVTFYPRWGQVRTHFVLDNGWSDRAQDQRFQLTLFNGGAETNQVYDSTVEVVLPARSRIVEEVWSTTPGASSQDLNREYMESTKVIPEFGGLTIGSQAIALEKAAFDATDNGATVGASPPHLGWGQWARDMAAGGGRPDIGLFPRWYARLLNSFHADLWTVMRGNAQAAMHAPFFYLEYNDTLNYCGTGDCGLGGSTITAFGRPISNDARPDLHYARNQAYTPSLPLPSPVGTVTIDYSNLYPYSSLSGGNAVNRWIMEMAHPPDPFFVPYLVTGDYVYMEALQTWAQYRMLLNRGTDPPGSTNYTHWGKYAIINDLEARGCAWPLRDLLHAALLSSDGTAEKTYFEEKLFNNFAWIEGKLGITNGTYYPAGGVASCLAEPGNFNSETNVWCAAYRWYGRDESNPLRWPTGQRGSAQLEGATVDVWTAVRQWMVGYWRIVMGHAGELYSEADTLAEEALKPPIHLILDSAYDLLFQIAAYNIPQQDGQYSFIDTWAAVKAGYQLTGALGRDLSEAGTTMYITGVLNKAGAMHTATGSVLTVGSEQVYRTGYTATPVQDSCTVDTATDQLTCTGHPFQAGDCVGLLADSTPGGATNGATYFVDVIDVDTVKLCTSSECSGYVDLTSTGSGVQLGMISFAVGRGYNSTTPAAYNAGEAVTYTGRTGLGEAVGHNYAMIARAGLSFAVGQGLSDVDEGNSSTLTAQAAWDTLNAALSATSRFGSDTDCAGVGLNDVNECDNPTWGFAPREYTPPVGPPARGARMPAGGIAGGTIQ